VSYAGFGLRSVARVADFIVYFPVIFLYWGWPLQLNFDLVAEAVSFVLQRLQ